jgi:DNA-binding XRE family transcriptional regulator
MGQAAQLKPMMWHQTIDKGTPYDRIHTTMILDAERVRDRLAYMKRSRAWLAREVGVAPATVSRWLAGKRSPRMPAATVMAAVLGLPIEAILEDEHGQ